MNELTCLILFDQPMKRLGYVWQNIPEIIFYQYLLHITHGEFTGPTTQDISKPFTFYLFMSNIVGLKKTCNSKKGKLFQI